MVFSIQIEKKNNFNYILFITQIIKLFDFVILVNFQLIRAIDLNYVF